MPVSLSVGVARVLGDRAARIGPAADGRCIVGAGDGDRDQLRDGAAVAVVDRDGERLGGGLADREVLRGAVGDRVGPADRAGARCRWRSRSPRRSVSVPPSVLRAGRHHAGAVWTSIRSTSLKAMVPVSLSVGRGRVLGDRAAASVSAAVMVGASLVPVTVTVTSCVTVPPLPSLDRDGERLGRGLADRQVLRGAVGDR